MIVYTSVYLGGVALTVTIILYDILISMSYIVTVKKMRSVLILS